MISFEISRELGQSLCIIEFIKLYLYKETANLRNYILDNGPQKFAATVMILNDR